MRAPPEGSHVAPFFFAFIYVDIIFHNIYLIYKKKLIIFTNNISTSFFLQFPISYLDAILIIVKVNIKMYKKLKIKMYKKCN